MLPLLHTVIYNIHFLVVGIYSIWFYDKRDCQRIAQLMVKIVKQEAEHARRESPERAAPERSNGVAEPRPIDILELLSKAKEEYQRAQVSETDVSAELNLKAAFTAAEQSTPKAEKSSHTMVKQITVEELFGSSLPKGPSLPIMPTQNSSTASSDPSTAYLQNQPYPTPALQTPLFPPHHSSQDPASGQRHQVPGLLPAPYALQPGSVFQSRSPAGPEPHAAPSAPPTAYLGQDMLATLKAAVPLVNHDLHKPILAPNFLPNRLFTPHSFQEPAVRPSLQHSKEIDVFSQPPNLIKPMSAVPMSPGFAVPGPAFSLLLSPSAFQQSFSQTSAASAAPPAPSEQAVCSKTQLQDTLIHLIKSDPDFLSAIHDAYLQSVSKDFSNMKL
ncbi:hypothetical protein KUCAC02_012646 [Chaenocephalus aceratus]|uniref:Uncharacterized protein n=1 Tax=Chaenocephalus aceratus TaxID=36190 RepID=A0ACB9XB84_CHAAC|nr:hypothetical protein KUCAC02_012646 [Chaenocephalus aceratus]